MQYLGGKHRLSKYIAPIINAYIEENGIETYYEPFVGAANVVEKIKCNKRFASDIDADMIGMFKAMQGGWTPPTYVSYEDYTRYKEHKEDMSPELRAFVSIGCSFGGKKWGGYARSSNGPVSEQSYRNVLKQIPLLDDISFTHEDYRNLKPESSVIYCDPPYANTTGYRGEEFDTNEFWQVMKEWGKHNTIFISEYYAPSSSWVKLLTEFDHPTSINNLKSGMVQVRRSEKLFIVEKAV
jgi:DNA adenine methylase